MLIRVHPTDYAVHVGWKGEVRRAGQGMSTWTWPWESCVTFPATLQWTQFAASQITRENQGVDVKGAFSWRVVDPVKAFRCLDMSPVRIEEIRDMLGAEGAATGGGPLLRTTLQIRGLAEAVTRNVIANMTLEEALRDRAAIVQRLTAQMDAVLEPWGGAIASIEIVDIYVSSRELFGHMQATFRERLRREARAAQIAAEEGIATQQLDSEARVSRMRHDHALATVALREEAAMRELDSEQAVELRRVGVKAGVGLEATRTEAARKRVEVEGQVGARRVEHAFGVEQRRERLDLLARRNEVLGEASDACRAMIMTQSLPKIVQSLRPDRTTVFANSVASGTLEGLGASLLSLADAAGRRPQD